MTNSSESTPSYERDQVVKIINSVVSKVEGAEHVSKEAIFSELSDLQRIIQDTRNEMGVTRAADIKDKHIPVATDELDAVVEATAEATGKIMDACDIIQEHASGESADTITNAVMSIYEACSFQDITGQRITKVVTTIKTIEEKVDRLMNVLGGVSSGDASSVEDDIQKEDPMSDAALLNGPQMTDDAISQEEIDKLLAELD